MHTIPEAIEAIARGEMIILTDDESRENEGDLVIAAEKVTPQAINFMAKHGRGLICLAMAPELIDQLRLPLMAPQNQSSYGTAFTISIEARTGVTTGISAADRARTIQVAIAPDAKPGDVISPGHVFPLRAKEQGVLVRPGQTEGSVDLARLAGLRGAGVICEIMNDDGTMARLPDLKKFSKEFGLKLVSVRDLIAYRMKTEILVDRVSEARLPLEELGDFKIVGFKNRVDGVEHLTLVKGELSDLAAARAPLVRIHSECLTGDVLKSMRCDCGTQLRMSLRMIEKEGCGALVYMRSHEGRGIGLLNKVKAYALQDQGLDTVEANQHLGFAPDMRDYGIGAQILKSLGIHKFRLLTNNPQKILELQQYGFGMIERLPLEVAANSSSYSYLRTKRDKLGHLLETLPREVLQMREHS